MVFAPLFQVQNSRTVDHAMGDGTLVPSITPPEDNNNEGGERRRGAIIITF